MGKRKQPTEAVRCAVNKKHAKLARERAAQEQSAQEKRRENAQKSRRMGSAYLLVAVSIISLFCLYTLIRTLIPPAGSLSELRDDLLFVSLVALPCLLAAAALLLHRLNAKRREAYSDRSKRFAAALFLVTLLAAFALFGFQMLHSRQDASQLPAYVQTVEALEQSGLRVTAPEQVDGTRTLLEYSLQADWTCGSTTVRLHFHADSAGWITNRFQKQAELDYADYPMTEAGAARVFGPVVTDGAARAAVVLESEDGIRIIELNGPNTELEALLPLLTNNITVPD